MPKVPCYEIIDAVRNGNGDMRSIRSGLARNRSERKQTPGKFLGFLDVVARTQVVLVIGCSTSDLDT